MSLIVDASVLVKLLAEEDGSHEARQIFVNEPDLVAPDFAVAEVFSALWKKWRRGQFRPEQLDEVPGVLADLVTRLVPIAELIEPAARLSRSLDHPIYDCFYLALAERDGLPFVTADARLLAAAARVAGVEARRLV